MPYCWPANTLDVPWQPPMAAARAASRLAWLPCARRFAGDHGLVAERRKKIRLHDLPFDNGRDHAQHRLAGKYQRAFGHRPHVAREAEFREILEKFAANVAEDGMLTQVLNFLSGEVHVLQKIERLFQTGGHQIIPVRRKMTDEKFERGASLEAGLQVTRRHRQLVQIG